MSFQGKRTWDLSWSFISQEEMFPRNFQNNLAGYYNVSESGNTWSNNDYNSTVDGTHSENIVSNFMGITMGGTIPFIFQSDTDHATNYAICVLDRQSLSIKRVTHDTYSIKMRILEI